MYISRIAKDGREQTTKQHLQDSADYAFHVGKKIEAAELCQTATLFHDIGKFSYQFVNYLRESFHNEQHGDKTSQRGSVVHSTQGAKFIYQLPQNNTDIVATLTREVLSICIANHHGGLMDGVSPDGETPLQNRLQREDEHLHYKEIIEAAKEDQIPMDKALDMITRCEIEMKDFIEKCRVNHLNIDFMIHLFTKNIFSCLVDSDRYNAYCFEANKPPNAEILIPKWGYYAQQLEQRISTFSTDSEINRIRGDISEKCFKSASLPKGIYQLDVPTGGGKTLSSLRFALNHAMKHGFEHVIYVIPYLSVLDQTAKDIKKALLSQPGDEFILEHHSNWTISENEKEAQAYRLLTDRWDCPIIITTLVQFLESIYSNKSGDLRKFHNMANTVFIFDEVQSLPTKCTFLFNEAINYLHYCAGCSILLCTATQPPLNRAERPIKLSSPAELIADTQEAFKRLKRTRIIDKTVHNGYNTEELQQFVIERYHEEKNCLVILNTKKDAAKLYLGLKKYVDQNTQLKIELIHLSTQMCSAHRLKEIEKIKERKQKNTICVSTQLIEAGVDISFGCVIRAIAGLDSIAQAAGRCNRNREDPNGKNVYIVNIADENLSMLPDIKCGADITYRILREGISDLLSSAAMERYYNEYFEKKKNQMAYPVERMGNLYDLLSTNGKGVGAFHNQNRSQPPALHQSFQTAGELFSVIEQRTTSVSTPYGEGLTLAEEYRKADIDNRYKLMRQIGRYSVSLYPYQINELNKGGALSLMGDDLLAIDANYYDKNLGIIFNPELEPLFW